MHSFPPGTIHSRVPGLGEGSLLPELLQSLVYFFFPGTISMKVPGKKKRIFPKTKRHKKDEIFWLQKRVLSKPCRSVPATSVGTNWTGTVLEGLICGGFWTFLPPIPCHTDLKWTRIDFERFRSESIWSKSPFPLWTFLDVARIRSGPGMIFLKIDPSPLSLCHSLV